MTSPRRSRAGFRMFITEEHRNSRQRDKRIPKFRARQQEVERLDRPANMLNCIWLGLILLAVLIGGFDNRMKDVASGAVDGAKSAVTLSFGLIGVWAVWLGMMRRGEKAGLEQALAGLLRRPLRRLFPDVPPDHPARGPAGVNVAVCRL